MGITYEVADRINELKGRRLSSVELSPDKECVTFLFQDGHEASFEVEGDCCSKSWIEHLEVFPSLQGATFIEAVEDEMNETKNDALNPPKDATSRDREHESLMVYKTRFKFDRGEVVLEYRNSSNGYYGGYLRVPCRA